MNWKHLLWIVPLCLFIGSLSIFFTFSWFYDMTAWTLTGTVTEALEDAMLAWEETPLSDERIFYEGEFCYLINDQPVCPKRKDPRVVDDVVITNLDENQKRKMGLIE